NKHVPLVTTIEGVKTWDDANNQDGIRPAEITVNLLANGEKVAEQTVTADDEWAYSFSNLPVNKAGKAITYTVAEEAVEGYEAIVNGYNITNKHVPSQPGINEEDKGGKDSNQNPLPKTGEENQLIMSLVAGLNLFVGLIVLTYKRRKG
ncbi:Cna B-type domain-containing protein, partial [Facklamia sp. P12955]|uniref:Cna B-type domain-containing protein n=1 Tax=Facklamia sp. P12955 TaxID=3421946 RepID=UPI003D163C6C